MIIVIYNKNHWPPKEDKLSQTLTAVRRVISFPIRSTSTGRHDGSSAPRWSPNVETTSPIQEIAHSFTSYKRRAVSYDNRKRTGYRCKSVTNLILILIGQTWHDSSIYRMNIRFKIKVINLAKKIKITFWEVYTPNTELKFRDQEANLNIRSHNTNKLPTYS